VDACDDIVTESFHMKKGSEGKRGAFVMTLTIKCAHLLQLFACWFIFIFSFLFEDLVECQQFFLYHNSGQNNLGITTIATVAVKIFEDLKESQVQTESK